MAEKKKYRFKVPVVQGDKIYDAGAVVELTEQEAAAFPWAVEQQGSGVGDQGLASQAPSPKP